MSVKNILLLGAAGAAVFSMAASYAGGSDQMSKPVHPVYDAGYYIGVDVGYAIQNYHDNGVWRVAGTGVASNNDGNTEGGFSGAFNLGYQVNKNIAVELGWFYLPSVNVNTAGSVNAWMDSWSLYLAAKYMMPMPRLKSNLFFKVGVQYKNVSMPASATVFSNGTISKRSSDYVRPMFAIGCQRRVSDNLSANFQYTYLMGARNSFPFATTNSGALGTVAANVFTFGMAYMFTV